MTTNSKEADFGIVFQRHLQGCGSLADIVEHIECQQRILKFARKQNFNVFHGDRDAHDLRQEVSLKLLEGELNRTLQLPDNILTEAHFFVWLYYVVRNHHFDTIRQRLALKRERLRSDKPSEEYDCFPAFECDHDREMILSLFPEFIKQYPVERQWTIRLWLKNRPSRTIKEILKRFLKVKISHVTVRNWINATIRDFRISLEVRPTQRRRRTGTG